MPPAEYATMIGFIFKLAFWFSLTLLFIPIGDSQHAGKEDTISPTQALFAAREAFGDIAGLCERKPDVCDAGGAAMATIRQRARETVRIAYDYLDESPSRPAPKRPVVDIPENQ